MTLCYKEVSITLLQLDPAEAATRQRPQRFWVPQDLHRLVRVRSTSETDIIRLGEIVAFKSDAQAKGELVQYDYEVLTRKLMAFNPRGMARTIV